MKAILTTLAALAFGSSGAAFAADGGQIHDDGGHAMPGLALSASEQAAVARAGQWRARKAVLRTGADGKVLFLFGHSQPTLVCAPLQVCDIEFEAGEIIKDVNLGDTVHVYDLSLDASRSPAVHRFQKKEKHLWVCGYFEGRRRFVLVDAEGMTFHFQIPRESSRRGERLLELIKVTEGPLLDVMGGLGN